MYALRRDLILVSLFLKQKALNLTKIYFEIQNRNRLYITDFVFQYRLNVTEKAKPSQKAQDLCCLACKGEPIDYPKLK